MCKISKMLGLWGQRTYTIYFGEGFSCDKEQLRLGAQIQRTAKCLPGLAIKE